MNDTGLDAVVQELQLARTEMREGFEAVVRALQGLGLRIENLRVTSVLELRTANEQLISLDEKLDAVHERVTRAGAG